MKIGRKYPASRWRSRLHRGVLSRCVAAHELADALRVHRLMPVAVFLEGRPDDESVGVLIEVPEIPIRDAGAEQERKTAVAPNVADRRTARLLASGTAGDDDGVR